MRHSLFHCYHCGGCCSPERRSIQALHYGVADGVMTGFLYLDIILYHVAALAQAVNVEYVTGVARSQVVAYVVQSVVAVSGAGG